MTTATAQTTPATTTTARAGQVVSGLVTAFLLFDVVIHILNIAPVIDGARALGFDPDVMPVIGVLELVLVVLYAVPRTSVLGAVLITGYLGGAVCAQLRIDAPLLSTTMFPVYVGVAVWAGLWLRDARVRGLLASR
ncbi:DoxX family protein [soil metagenome]